MVSLIIDCSYGMNVYLIKNDEVFSKIDNNQKKHTDELLLCIDEMFSKASLKIDDVENLCVCIGPGSFTGIRVAISICKGLAIESKMKIFAASNFDIVQDENVENAVYILDGFSKYVYVRILENGKIYKDECVEIDEIISYLKNKKDNVCVFVQSEKTQNLLKINEIHSNIVQNNAINYFLNKISKNENIEINKINPIYLRASQAEMERNKKIAEGK